MYLIHNEGKSVIVEMFIKTLKAKIHNKIIANDSESYLRYLNELIDQYNDTYHHSVGKNPINADYSSLSEKNETNSKAPRLMIESELLSITMFLVLVTLKIGQEKYFLLILFWKLILGLIKLNIEMEKK